jgi:hypothetical protein
MWSGVGRLVGVVLFVFVISAIFTGLTLKAFPFSKNHPEKELHPRTELTDDIDLQIPFVIDSLCHITDSNHA